MKNSLNELIEFRNANNICDKLGVFLNCDIYIYNKSNKNVFTGECKFKVDRNYGMDYDSITIDCDWLIENNYHLQYSTKYQNFICRNKTLVISNNEYTIEIDVI